MRGYFQSRSDFQSLTVRSEFRLRPERSEQFSEQQDLYEPLHALPEDFYGGIFRTPDGRPRIESVGYKRKDETPLFQVADYLASAISHAIIDQASGKAQMT